MTNALRLVGLGAMITVLSACALHSHSRSIDASRWATTQDKLANGKLVKISMFKPTMDWGCMPLDKQSFKWSSLQYQAQFIKLDDAYDVLRAKVVKYANDQKLNTNYIYFTAPTATTAGGFSLQAPADRDDVKVTYYQCSKVGI